MFRALLVLLFCGGIALGAGRSELPVTTMKGEAADLVRQWWQEGTAAGNGGDFYDNRDRGHRMPNLKLFPQVQSVAYSTNEILARFDYASARMIRTNVTIGNSSTSAFIEDGGSNTRSLYVRAGGVPFLHEQYRRNNLYAYPEHNDHDPGHNGNPGYGDVFPLNTPYLYTSQGSSGSEIGFLEAAFLTLASFRPEVKERLIQRGLLMPTVQMLMRRAYNKQLDPSEYLTGRAHPSVFESAAIDVVSMVRGAHGIELDTIPPMVQLRVVSEDEPRSKIDYFDYANTEKSCDTPSAIGRLFRGVQQTRRMIVSAESSYDLNLRPLTFRWSILQGDTNRITIKPLNERGSRVEITVAWQERRPIDSTADIESNRVDIGCFAHNSFYYSAPGFVCWFFMDSEARTYEPDGRILDIGYNLGTPRIEIIDWKKFFDICREGSPRSEFLRSRLGDENWEALTGPAQDYERLAEENKAASEVEGRFSRALGLLEKETPKNEGEKQALQLARADRDNARARRVEAARALEKNLEPARAILEPLIRSWQTNVSFTFTDRRDLERVYKAADRNVREEFERGKELLQAYGLMKKSSGFDFTFTPAREKAGPLDERLTVFEKNLVERLNSAAISLLVLQGAAKSSFKVNYVDRALTAAKDWRDVYRYNSAGELLGWTRYAPGGTPAEFNAAGMVISGSKTESVVYDIQRDAKTRTSRMVWKRGK